MSNFSFFLNYARNQHKSAVFLLKTQKSGRGFHAAFCDVSHVLFVSLRASRDPFLCVVVRCIARSSRKPPVNPNPRIRVLRVLRDSDNKKGTVFTPRLLCRLGWTDGSRREGWGCSFQSSTLPSYFRITILRNADMVSVSNW